MPLLTRVLRPLFRAYFSLCFSLEWDGLDRIPRSGPYIIISNHVHIMDPFFISPYMPHNVRWMAGSYLFRMKALGSILARFLTSIPKNQGRNDMQMMRILTAAFKKGEVVGLFPEATRTWDGEPIAFDKALVKLIRIFKVPVVCINLEGGYFLHPRWAYSARKGPLTIRVVETLMPQDIEAMTLDALYQRIEKNIGFSHRAMQQKTPLPYRSTRRTEGISQILYLTPGAPADALISSQGDIIRCPQIGLEVRMDEYDRLHVVSGTCPFPDIPAWREWERHMLHEAYSKGTLPAFRPDKGARLEMFSDERLRLRYIGDFLACLEKEGIRIIVPAHSRAASLPPFERKKKEAVAIFLFSEMTSLIVNAKCTMEFSLQGKVWRLRLKKGEPVLKYSDLFTDIKNPESRSS
ncbi:phospholipid/glycerol acyltransferase [Parasphaerochaeta coccoides DSM 17374]|uniref:Phospholipid/glycerol acyltransferase n=2 Tax=Parasphaerochaeta TaxID=3062336 RepID=F4GM75_PARC1|nr:phospholipid/glycerol acyltransferase [Parasphaerochaeta coccoides DSM 17374]